MSPFFPERGRSSWRPVSCVLDGRCSRRASFEVVAPKTANPRRVQRETRGPRIHRRGVQKGGVKLAALVSRGALEVFHVEPSFHELIHGSTSSRGLFGVS